MALSIPAEAAEPGPVLAITEENDLDKEPFVGEWRSGIALVFQHVQLAYSHVVRTREFEKQPHKHVYGSLSLSVRF